MKNALIKRRLAELTEELSRREPALMREYLLLQELDTLRSGPSGAILRSVKLPGRAIELVLAERNDFMTKQEIADALAAEGMVTNDAQRYTLNDLINYRIRNGFLIKVGEETGWKARVGLAEWAGRAISTRQHSQ